MGNDGKGEKLVVKAIKRRYAVLILMAVLVLASQGYVLGSEKKRGVFFPAESGLQEIDEERNVTIKWLENFNFSFTPGHPQLQGTQQFRIFSGKKMLFNRRGGFGRFFEAEDFPYLKCKSFVVRRNEEGHNSDSFIILTAFPDKKTALYEIMGIWDEKSIALIIPAGPDGLKAVRLRFGSYCNCADRYSYSRAAVFDKDHLTWRLDRVGERPEFYRRLIVEVENELRKLMRESATDKDDRKRSVSILVFEIVYYRYMMGEPLDKTAANILSGFAFSAEERACINEMIREVRNEMKNHRKPTIAKRYRLDSSFSNESKKAKRALAD
jgi:hypothetical protein